MTLKVELGSRSYDIHVGAGLTARAGELLKPVLPSPRVIIVSDETVAKQYAPALEAGLKESGIAPTRITIPAGEGSKGFAQLEKLCEQILTLTPDRKTTIVALGGGVVGDLAGFAASILLRGLPFVQIPTTLLAQVDSSVGGKTAINAASGKNLIGSFHQPRMVIADTDTLKTLPPRERRAGYAEIIKYGLIMNADFYRWCLANAAKILEGDAAALTHAITESCRMKAEIVGQDERESDRRALLNFGHTFGHALEAETGYGDTLLHGEAVAVGMVMACRLSAELGGPDIAPELAAHFKSLGMPASPLDIPHPWDAAKIAAHYAGDKKAEDGALTFVVLEAIGRARIRKNTDQALAARITAACLEK